MSGVVITIAATAAHQDVDGAVQGKVREAGVAGSFYPADAVALTAMMDSMLARAAPPTIQGPIFAVVAPHAGYQYSGPVAAYTYAALKGRKFSRVVVIAPSHFEGFDFTSVYDGDAYATPLGTIPVDKEFAKQLAKVDSSIQLSERGHKPTSQGAEHALEVQLPWLQHVLGNFTLVPIIVGGQSYENCRALGVALAKLITKDNPSLHKRDSQTEPDTLIVASSDLSHYHTYEQAEKLDHKTLDALQSWDYFSMARNFQTRVWEACGGGPIVAAMIASERMGANQAKLLRYANSGDVVPDHSRVVGYGAAAFVKAPNQKSEEKPFSLSDEDKDQLLTLARISVEHMVRNEKPYEPAEISSAALNQERGAFVTLREAGDLRGCIGYTSAIKPLYMTVRDTATLAAVRDPRFHPVSGAELSRLEYEISVLSPLRRVRDVHEISVGTHGLMIKSGNHEGLLLPQVPVEQKWDREKFLEETCRKAGADPDCWKDEATDIFAFTALVFSEQHAAVAAK